MRKILILFIFLFSNLSFAQTHILKFEGVPAKMSTKIKKAFGFVFEREVNPSEAEQVMRFLMATQEYSNIEIHERFPEDRPAEYVIVASLLRTIKGITVTGNSQFSRSQIIQTLKIDMNQIFTRKEILANADELQTEYAEQGYLNPQIDIDFETPKETEIIIHVKIKEGEPSTITDMSFDCANPEIVKKAKKISRHMIGSRLSNPSLKDFESSMKDYFSNKRYLRARISSPNLAFNKERNKVKVNYVIDNPTQYEFVFEGNKYFTDGQLIDSIELEKVLGATTSFAPDLSDRIRKTYLAAGFANVQVEYKEKSFEKSFREQVRFKIIEGMRVRIKTLVVEGQLTQPEKYYSGFIKENSSDTIALGFYNRKDLEAGQKNLITELQNQGFLQAKILASRTGFSKSKEFSDTTISIEEGPQTIIKEINFKSNALISGPELLQHMSIQPGSAFKQKDLEQSIRALKDYYHSLGYLEMRILNEDDKLVAFNSDNTEARLNFLIQEGPKVIVSSIEIQGLVFTKPEVVMREISFGPGDVLTPESIDETTYHLQKLQLFSSVQIKTDADGTNISRRVVIITVSEDDAGNLNPGIGINNEHLLTYRGFVYFGYKNLFGTGRGVSARGDVWYSTDPNIQYLENRITLGYFEPWLFNSRNNGRINLTRQERFSSTDVNSAAVIENKTISDFLIERDLSRHLKLTFYALEFSRTKDFYRFDQSRAPGFVDNTILLVDVAKIGPSFELDYRNDIFNPTRGTDTKVQLFYSDPAIGSSGDAQQYVHFFKTDNSVTNYLPLTKTEKVVWVNQVRGVYLANLSQNSDQYRGQPVSGIPSPEALSLGGSTTIRGFDVNEKIPNVYDLQPNGNGNIETFKYTVETMFYLFKSELRFPLYKAFGGAIFYDAGGVVVNQPGTQSPDTYRDSAGFGIRLNTPVGPVNLDLGFKLRRRIRYAGPTNNPKEESPFAFHFTVGNF